MGKDKLRRFAELGQFDRVFQPGMDEINGKEYFLKGRWKQEVFHNTNPLVLELGCGKGEYTIGMAQHFPDKNFIGVDIKGARMWKGARTSHEEKIMNAAFLRTRIEMISSFFAENEVDEIWITFPDPQPTERRKKKRLSGTIFLKLYRNFLVNNGIVHLKTDSDLLYNYTLNLLKLNNQKILFNTSNLYSSDIVDEILGIKTFYEKKFLEAGSNINYLKFSLNKNSELNELPEES
ncbi:MAG: tRNA (guanosine(46)-N7)-methyltransferase TrmB [Bacteroidales bacterium]|nr:tRNA (guanosine(46)-N7)-methyltransferase TrmB [Bacteroidales bacterium]MCB9012699.1 tRNA (guanosine(46)-N7)-methyltransferase TrmB [Bacteroidales bacterium]